MSKVDGNMANERAPNVEPSHWTFRLRRIILYGNAYPEVAAATHGHSIV